MIPNFYHQIARQHQQDYEKEFSLLAAKQEEDDFEIANRLEESDRHIKASERTFLQKQEEDDSQMSHRLEKCSMRAEHRIRKFDEMIAKGLTAVSVKNLWIHADPLVDDVMDGICISILLPNIKRLDVKLVSKRTVTVEAERLVGENEGPGEWDSDFVFILTLYRILK